MNKKGFTLVELVATIVILGVILTIAVPSYNSYIEKSKESKCNADKRAILDAAKTYVTQSIYKNTTIASSISVAVLRTQYGLSAEYDKYDNPLYYYDNPEESNGYISHETVACGSYECLRVTNQAYSGKDDTDSISYRFDYFIKVNESEILNLSFFAPNNLENTLETHTDFISTIISRPGAFPVARPNAVMLLIIILPFG